MLLMSAIWPSLNIPAVNLFVFCREKFGGILLSIFSLPLFKYWYIFCLVFANVREGDKV